LTRTQEYSGSACESWRDDRRALYRSFTVAEVVCYPVAEQMSPRSAKLFLIAAAALLANACGSPGIPQPPSLEVARPVTDLRATRKGNTVTLTWSPPTHTTEQRNISHGETVEVCRAPTPIKQCGTPVARIRTAKPASIKTQKSDLETYADQLQSNLTSGQPTSNVYYGVAVLNHYGRSAGLSNQVQVPAAPTLTPPENFQAQLTPDGVKLSWSSIPNPPNIPDLRLVYRIYRREAGTQTDAVAGEVPVASDSSPSLLDRGFEWEKPYAYRATVVTKIVGANGGEQQVEGDDTPSVSVVTHDIFPPATPTGLQAVFSGPGQKLFIDLVWAPDSEPDLAGYNVYRREAGAQASKINKDVVSSPAYRDTDVSAGCEYTYSVSAVDVRGNESSRSEEASEVADDSK
jgi:hypothetical protein